jgi:adenylate kinase family enzyme
MVVGPSGSGKSTVARDLAAITGLPVVHLDAHYWRPGWDPTPDDEWARTLAGLVAGERWVMDGNYSRSGELAARVARSDAVIFLDRPRRLSYLRIVRRRLRHHGVHRPEMAEGCTEKIDREFIAWIWRWPKRSRPGLVRILADAPATVQVFTLRSDRAVRALLDEVRASTHDPS